MAGLLAIVFCFSENELRAVDNESNLVKSIVFHAPFDGTEVAYGRAGKLDVLTADSPARKNVRQGNHLAVAKIIPGAGRYGDALRFEKKSDSVLYYPGTAIHYSKHDWSGTVSFWMRLDPNRDLAPGYCDPIQITDKTWNDAAFFVDFDKDIPRDFRLGVFADFKFWNPTNIAWEKLPLVQRPMVTVKNPPFSANKWTHILFTFTDINSAVGKDAAATLFIDGLLRGSIRRPLQFHWDMEKVALMIGIYYTGDLDDLAVFDRALSADEVNLVYELPNGIGPLKAQ